MSGLLFFLIGLGSVIFVLIALVALLLSIGVINQVFISEPFCLGTSDLSYKEKVKHNWNTVKKDLRDPEEIPDYLIIGAFCFFALVFFGAIAFFLIAFFYMGFAALGEFIWTKLF